MEKDQISGFYDDFSDAQDKTGVNLRIYSLYQRALKLGLTNSSRVLELGCGVGSITRLLVKKLKRGYIEAVDLSPRSVELLQKKLKSANLFAQAGDVVTYTPQEKGFDFVLLFDVIEHIPLDLHGKLFKNIASYMDDNTRILVNIPNPGYIEYDRIHQPEVLQVIDQPVYLEPLIGHLSAAGLRLRHFETYSIWVKDDYQFMILEKKKEEFVEIALTKGMTFLQKIAWHLRDQFVKRRYN